MQRFAEISLPELLINSLNAIKFEVPTAVQSQAIPVLLEGRDLIACAQTGSGKTGAYLIPMLKTLLEDPKSQGMVLAPTRELAQQIYDFLRTLVSDDRQFNSALLLGGQDIRKQFKALQRRPRVIVATPGRLIDHLKRNTVQIHRVNKLVIDEGDRMIDMGFAPQLREILDFLPQERQTSFFTATMDRKVQELAKRYLVNPVSLMLDTAKPVSSIKQSAVLVALKDKDQCILNELNARTGSVIVFLKTKHKTDRLKKYLSEYGFNVDLIHGGRSQGQRNKAISSFKSGHTRILCATDVAARGIDVPHVEHVINFDLPMQDEDYVHRVGRTARNGAEGEAISLVTPDEHHDWNRLVKKYDIPNGLIATANGAKGDSSKPSKGRSFRGGSRRGSDFSYGSRDSRRSSRDSRDFSSSRRSEDSPRPSRGSDFSRSSSPRRSEDSQSFSRRDSRDSFTERSFEDSPRAPRTSSSRDSFAPRRSSEPRTRDTKRSYEDSPRAPRTSGSRDSFAPRRSSEPRSRDTKRSYEDSPRTPRTSSSRDFSPARRSEESKSSPRRRTDKFQSSRSSRDSQRY